jgi:hypothetical protein
MLVGDIITSAREIWPDLAIGGDADANGNMISAATAYRWLNEALLVLGRAANGIYDSAGATSVTGQGIYQLTNFNQSTWIKFTKAWYDGWELNLGNASNIFRRNATPAISCQLTSVKTSNVIVVEFFPQPITNGGATTLAAPLGTGDTSIACADLSSFQLSQGLALIGGVEVVSFGSVAGNTLGQMVRGLGGSVPTAAIVGATAAELNIRFSGMRMPRNNYAVGNKNVTLDVPIGWEPSVINYMESRFRQVEKEFSVAAQLRNGAINEVKALASQNKPVAGPRQMGDAMPNETYGTGLGGGWFIS